MLTSNKLEAIRKEVNDELATLRGGDGRSHRFARMASELLGHIQYLEARAGVVPEIADDELRKMILSAARRKGRIDFDPEDVSDGDLEILREIRDDLSELFCAIPADRVLGDENQFGVGFVEACGILAAKPFDRPALAAGLIREGGTISALAETTSDGPGISILREEMRADLDALRANQGGAAT